MEYVLSIHCLVTWYSAILGKDFLISVSVQLYRQGSDAQLTSWYVHIHI